MAEECGPSGASESSMLDELMETDVQKMIDGRGYDPKPLQSWRKCPFIQASRKSEFRPVPDGVMPEIRHLPEHVRTLLNGCKVFQPQQIEEYNCMLQCDGKLVSGIEHLNRRDRVKPGRLYHKFDSLCALATSKAGRLLLIQHRALNHVFYAIAFDPAHKLYIELLNMYERRWGAVSKSYGKDEKSELEPLGEPLHQPSHHSEAQRSSYFEGRMKLIRGPERTMSEAVKEAGALEEGGPSEASEGSSALDKLMETEVQRMIDGNGCNPKPLRSWRKCPFIQASRKREFRPVPDGMTPEIRHLPEHVRTLLPGCKVFQPQQIAEYNCILQQDGQLVSGVDHLHRRDRVKPGRLYHKFDSLCDLATSKAGRLLLIQHRTLNHVFYAIVYDPAHKLYIELLNMYERRWAAVNPSYGKDNESE